MFTIRKQFEFEAAHRLTSAYSKDCVNSIHGHSYKVEIFLKSKTLNSDNMVIDFGELKPWIEEIKNIWDHSLFITEEGQAGDNKKIFYTDGINPTAEWMAEKLYFWLMNYLQLSLKSEAWAHSIRVHETRTGWAEFSVEEE